MGIRGDESVQNEIRKVNMEARPRTVSSLVALVKDRNPKLSDWEILSEIRQLAASGQIQLLPRGFEKFSEFWIDLRWNFDFWLVLLVGLTGLFSVLVSVMFPWTLFRLLFVIPVFFYFPGHSLLGIISSRTDFRMLERTLLDVGTSVVLVLLVGLVLNFSGQGFLAVPSVSLIFLLNLVLAFMASFRHFGFLHTE